MRTAATDPSRAIRARRRDVLGVGLRYVAQQTDRLAKSDPEHFAPVSHGTLSRIENSQGEWFTHNVNVRLVQSLVQVLWGGDYQAFVADTGLPLPLPLYAHQLPPAQPPQIPYHLEGERPSLYVRDRRAVSPPYPGVEFALGAVSNSMAPVVHAGQVMWCTRDTQPEPGRIAVLLREHGLEAAWALGEGEYATERARQAFRLGHGESVFGTVAYLEPFDPNTRARLAR